MSDDQNQPVEVAPPAIKSNSAPGSAVPKWEQNAKSRITAIRKEVKRKTKHNIEIKDLKIAIEGMLQ